MIIYSVSITIDKTIESNWMKWMKETHIQDVINTKYFFDCKLQKQIIPGSSKDGITFRLDYLANSFEDYQKYSLEEAPRLQAEHSEKFAGKFKASRTVFTLLTK